MCLRQMQKIAIYSTGLLLLAFSAGCGETKNTEAPPPAEVRYMRLATKPLVLTRELPGRVVAFQTSEVRPQVGGIIRERLFVEGSDVEEGQVLYQIDPAVYQAAYNSAKADLAHANANLASARLLAQRYAKIVKTNAISRQDYDDAVASHNQARAAVESAKQNLETASINLGYTKVTAPVSGRIGRSLVTPGALATENQPTPLALVQQLDKVYVDLTHSSAELLKLRRSLAAGRLRSGGPNSAKVKLLLEDGSPYVANIAGMEQGEAPQWVEGELLFSDVTIEQSTGAVALRATFENPDNILLPGMYVRAVLEEGVNENALLVPQKAVMRDYRGEPYVYVLTREKQEPEHESIMLAGDEYFVVRRSITIDRDHENHWLVTEGLKENEFLLIDGQQKARAGQVVCGRAIEQTHMAGDAGIQIGYRR